MRSFLFVPGDSSKKQEKGLTSGADCLFLDLEDSVALTEKANARNIVHDFIVAARSLTQRPKLYVRVNALDTDLIDADLDAVMPAAPDGILLPKAISGASIQHLGAKLAVREAECGHDDGATRILAIANETAASIFHMGTFTGASQRLLGLTWGAEDLAADLGAETNRASEGGYTAPFALARSLTLFAAQAAGVAAIDTVYANFRDMDGFRVECLAARRDGYVGKMAIHPAQVAVINEVFTPDEAAIARAQAIVAAFEANPGAGVIAVAGQMLDKPHWLRAKRLLERAALVG